MAKRFRDTNISREAWYRKLSPVFKCTWCFLCDECDVAGMWAIDAEALEFFVGEVVDIDQFIEAVNTGKTRVERYGEDKLFVAGFIEFQYGELSESCKPHTKVISLLRKYGLYERVCIPFAKGIHTLQEKEEDKDKEREEETEKEKAAAQKSKPRLNGVAIKPVPEDPTATADYAEIVAKIEQGLDVKESWKLIMDFINQRKPTFLQPYMDLWNIFAQRYNLPQTRLITDGRRNKIRARTREPDFDFVKILEAIKHDDFLLGKVTDWKADFDYVIRSQDTYVKILEKKP